MVEIFKTDVTSDKEAELIVHILIKEYPTCKINFDLRDEDHILRVEGNSFNNLEIIHILGHLGYDCDRLD